MKRKKKRKCEIIKIPTTTKRKTIDDESKKRKLIHNKIQRHISLSKHLVVVVVQKLLKKNNNQIERPSPKCTP